MRPSTHRYFLDIAKQVARRSTCYRRAVGCVLVDANARILSTGYNGVASGMPHCNESIGGTLKNLCSGALSKSGTDLHACRAVHAEANALINCRDPEDIRTAYCTASPCLQCLDFLLNTPCQEIVFSEHYPHTGSQAKWEKMARKWLHLPDEVISE